MARDSLESRLRVIQEDFARKLPARIDELVSAWDQDLPLPARLKQVHQLAHRLAGGAGTLGQPAVSAAAKALELALQELLEAGGEPDAATVAGFRARSAALVETIQDFPAGP